MSTPHRKHKRRLRFHRRTAPGAAPGSLVVDPLARKPVLHVMAYRGEEFEERALENLAGLPRLLSRYAVVWLHVDGLGSAELLGQLAEQFNLHRLALEDVVNLHQRAKVEHYDENLFIVVRMPRLGAPRPETEQLSLFLGHNFLLTLAEDPGDCLDPLRHRLRQESADLRRAGPDHLAYGVIDTVLDQYFPVLEQIGERLDVLEDRVLNRPSAETLALVHALKNDLLVVRRAIWPHREAINTLVRDPDPRIGDSTRLFLRDCYDHVVQIMELLEAYREVAADLRDAYLSSVSNRMNDVMRVLTVISTIFIPLTFITSIYGMNFDPAAGPFNMPELRSPWGYAGVWGAIIGVSAAMLYFFWRRGWLQPFSPTEVMRSGSDTSNPHPAEELGENGAPPTR